jgi:hypothetical protein
MALKALPDGWSGQVCTDSQLTLRRCFEAAAVNTIPQEWYRGCAAERRRLGTLTPVLLAGHPNGDELRDGFKIKPSGIRYPVSIHNKWADEECNRVKRDYLTRLALVK